MVVVGQPRRWCSRSGCAGAAAVVEAPGVVRRWRGIGPAVSGAAGRMSLAIPRDGNGRRHEVGRGDGPIMVDVPSSHDFRPNSLWLQRCHLPVHPGAARRGRLAVADDAAHEAGQARCPDIVRHGRYVAFQLAEVAGPRPPSHQLCAHRPAAQTARAGDVTRPSSALAGTEGRAMRQAYQSAQKPTSWACRTASDGSRSARSHLRRPPG